jgi:ATP-dependent helicase/nuclease subunit A
MAANAAQRARSTRPWTEAQLQAIQSTGSSLLVSAAAGSGKTSVLAERCVYLLCDAQDKCDVSELLVVTFTEAAAAEMKARIGRSLANRHLVSPSESTYRHLATLERASIGTLHSFCARVLRQNFQDARLGLDPNFRILDPDEAELLKLDTARGVFDERYDDPEATDFRRLVDCYADGKDDRLIKRVLEAYHTLCSVVDPTRWLNEARDRIESAIDLPMSKSELGMEYEKKIKRELDAILRECQAAANAIKPMRRFDVYVDYLRDIWRILKRWQAVFESNGIDGLREDCQTTEMAKLPSVASTVEGKEVAKARVDSVRKAMRDGPLRKNLLFTEEQWKQGLALTMPHVDVFLGLIAEFSDRYTAAKDEAGALDFADLEVLTLRCLRVEGTDKPSAIARGFHHQFKHVLVDEYQDINGVQDAILSLVSRECLGRSEASNLFCVGDVKQSIYRFRLAEAQQFLDRREKYSKPGALGKVIDLQSNFRSRAPLLKTINMVFEKLMSREAVDLDYDDSQKLVAGQTFPDVEDGFVGSPVELHLLPREGPGAVETEDGEEPLDRSEREAMLLGHRILEMIGGAGKPAMQVVDRAGDAVTTRPIRFGDIVVLLRSMRFKADQFAATLREMGVPVHIDSATGYFQATEVNDVLSLLHVLDNQRQDIHLAALLRSPLSQMPDAESNLTRIRLAYSGSPPVPFHLAVQKYAEEQKDALAEFLRNFRAQLEKWRQEARQQPVAEMLWHIYEQTGYLAYVSGLPNGPQREANLIELHDRATQFGTFQRQGLGRFLTFLEKLKKQTDLGQASIASAADDVVRIMSIHQSKGQEFPVVLLPDLGKAINMQDTQGTILLDRAEGLGLQVVDETLQVRYPSLASTVVQQRLRQQTLAEEMRVLYVAMTRAKEHLIMVGTCPEAQVEKWQQMWSGYKNKLPTETVLAARTTLDWLGPVAAIAPDQIMIRMASPEDQAGWTAHLGASAMKSGHDGLLAYGKPLSPAPPISAEAQAIMDRLRFRYPQQIVADLAATASVTSLVKKAGMALSAGEVPPLPSQSVDRLLSQPTFLAGQLPLDAADIGTATHAVLEHFDFSRMGEADVLEKQIQRLVETGRLTKKMADVVDREAILWFLQSEIGQLLGKNAAGLKRELPIYYANPSDAADLEDPMDQQMVRGRIDLLAPTPVGWMIVDYKTDRVKDEALDQRAALYAGQLEIYRKAIRQITGTVEVSAVLVFLHPREIRSV